MNEIEIEQKLNENLSASSGLKCHFSFLDLKSILWHRFSMCFFFHTFFRVFFCKNNFVFQQTVH